MEISKSRRPSSIAVAYCTVRRRKPRRRPEDRRREAEKRRQGWRRKRDVGVFWEFYWGSLGLIWRKLWGLFGPSKWRVEQREWDGPRPAMETPLRAKRCRSSLKQSTEREDQMLSVFSVMYLNFQYSRLDEDDGARTAFEGKNNIMKGLIIGIDQFD